MQGSPLGDGIHDEAWGCSNAFAEGETCSFANVLRTDYQTCEDEVNAWSAY